MVTRRRKRAAHFLASSDLLEYFWPSISGKSQALGLLGLKTSEFEPCDMGVISNFYCNRCSQIKSQTRECLLVSDLIAGFSLHDDMFYPSAEFCRSLLPQTKIILTLAPHIQHRAYPPKLTQTPTNSHHLKWPLNTLTYSLNLVFSTLHSFRLPILIPTIRRILLNLWRNSRARAFRAIGGDNTSVCFLSFLAVLLLLHAAESERNAHLKDCGEDGLKRSEGGLFWTQWTTW